MAALPTAALVLERALFERLVFALWVAQSEANVQQFLEAAMYEGLRQLRKFIDNGIGVLRRESTGEDVTEAIRKDPRFAEIKRLPSFEAMATATGIGDVYVGQYGFMSMFSHGNTYDLDLEPAEMLQMARSAAAGELAAVTAVLTAWYESSSQLTRHDLRQFLKV